MYSESLDIKAISSQRKVEDKPWADRFVAVQQMRVRYNFLLKSRAFSHALARITALETECQALDDAQLAAAVWSRQAELRKAVVEVEFNSEAVAFCFAAVREMSRRVLGLRHYDVQLSGGLIMLHGNIAEMETGEGKSLTALLTTVTAAVAGFPVHVITVNDYLAERDAEEFTALYARFGLDVGIIKTGLSPEERSEAYRKPVVYCTSKELAFDYLKDRLKFAGMDNRKQWMLSRLGDQNGRIDQPLMRGLYFAIIDEADSVLADEARTPLIISGDSDNGGEEDFYAEAIKQARSLAADEHFKINLRLRSIEWTPAGDALLPQLAAELGGLWSGPMRARELLTKALSALYLYAEGREYVVSAEGEVQIVDEYTGRILPDRRWEGGLHQLIEAKEECEISAQRVTLAKMTFQRFFRRYWRVAGMTGTIREIAAEITDVYGMGTVRIPTNKPCLRRHTSNRVFRSLAEKQDYIVLVTRELNKQGRPVLIGTRSVVDSRNLSAMLEAQGLAHRVLNAEQNQAEAEIIAEAGQLRQITVATNMAGRGTDIKPSAEALEAGGLHVIVTEPHDSLRVDRQLIGRCGRQGNPGTYQCVFSYADEMPQRFLPSWQRTLGCYMLQRVSVAGQWLAYQIIRLSQQRAEKANAAARRDLLKMDDKVLKNMGFSSIRE